MFLFVLVFVLVLVLFEFGVRDLDLDSVQWMWSSTLIVHCAYLGRDSYGRSTSQTWRSWSYQIRSGPPIGNQAETVDGTTGN